MGKFKLFDMSGSANDSITNSTIESWPPQATLAFGWKVFYTTILCPMIIVCVVGNALTIIAYIRDPKLQTVQNMYLLNLAIADFLVGCVSMPFYFVTTILDYQWIFGRLFCKIWNALDFLACLAGAYAVVLISVDRSLMVWQGAAYAVRQTKKSATLRIVMSWCLSFLIYVPAVFLWDVWTGQSIVPNGVCDVEFVINFPFTLSTAILEFVLPFVSITVLSIYLYVTIIRKSRVALNTRIWTNSSARSQASFHTICKELDGKPERVEIKEPEGKESESNSALSSLKERLSGSKKKKTGDLEKRILRRNQKAAQRLAVLVGVFVICWTPYTITTIVIAACGNCVDDHLYEALIWLQWANSVVNPFLYAFTTPRFRENYVRLLHLKRLQVRRVSKRREEPPPARTSVSSC
ncbi:histamine H3 receptor-like [Liolophura sinensis]|uniref:histamine H3 receptor-like n=1 Tax=Liolophura sinensis TaxID=3198878 RepID=UPI003159102E